MIERGDQFCRPFKTSAHFGFMCQSVCQHFDSDRAPQCGVFAMLYLPHAAFRRGECHALENCVRKWAQDQAVAQCWLKCAVSAAEHKTIMRSSPVRVRRIPASQQRCWYYVRNVTFGGGRTHRIGFGTIAGIIQSVVVFFGAVCRSIGALGFLPHFPAFTLPQITLQHELPVLLQRSLDYYRALTRW